MTSSPPSSPPSSRALVSDPDNKPIDVDRFEDDEDDGDDDAGPDANVDTDVNDSSNRNTTDDAAASRTIDLTGSDPDSPLPARRRSAGQSVVNVDDGHHGRAGEHVEAVASEDVEHDDVIEEEEEEVEEEVEVEVEVEVDSPIESVVEGEEDENEDDDNEDDDVVEEDVVVGEGYIHVQGIEVEEVGEDEAGDEDAEEDVIELEPGKSDDEDAGHRGAAQREIQFLKSGEGEGADGEGARGVQSVETEEGGVVVVEVGTEDAEGKVVKAVKSDGGGDKEEETNIIMDQVGDEDGDGGEGADGGRKPVSGDSAIVGEEGRRLETVDSKVADEGSGEADGRSDSDGDPMQVESGSAQAVEESEQRAEAQKRKDVPGEDRHKDAAATEISPDSVKLGKIDHRGEQTRDGPSPDQKSGRTEKYDEGDKEVIAAASGSKEETEASGAAKGGKSGTTKPKKEGSITKTTDSGEEVPKPRILPGRINLKKSSEAGASTSGDISAATHKNGDASMPSPKGHAEKPSEDKTSLPEVKTNVIDTGDKVEMESLSAQNFHATRHTTVRNDHFAAEQNVSAHIGVEEEGSVSREAKSKNEWNANQGVSKSWNEDNAVHGQTPAGDDDKSQDTRPGSKDGASQQMKPAEKGNGNKETPPLVGDGAVQGTIPDQKDDVNKEAVLEAKDKATQDTRIAFKAAVNEENAFAVEGDTALRTESAAKDVGKGGNESSAKNETIENVKSVDEDVEMSSPTISGDKEGQDEDADMTGNQTDDQVVSASESAEVDETDKEESEAEDVLMRQDTAEPDSILKKTETKSRPSDATGVLDVTASATLATKDTATTESEDATPSVVATGDTRDSAAAASQIIPESTDKKSINLTPQRALSPNLTTPMFGINPPPRSGPVSFSSPPSFHRPALNPAAKVFVPAAASSTSAGKSGQSPLLTPAQKRGKEATTDVSADVATEKSAKAPVQAPSKSTERETVDLRQKLAAAPTKVIEGKPLPTDSHETVDSKADKAKLSMEDAGKRNRYEQKLRRVPAKGTSGGMVYCVENVSISIKRGSGRPSRRPLLSTIELLTIPNGESKMEFSDSRSNPKNVWLSLSSVKDNVKVKKVTNKPNIMSVTVLGPSGIDTGSDASKYFIHLNKNTFQVFYDATLKFLLDFVVENPRPSVVKFSEPPQQERRASTSSMGAFRRAQKATAAKSQIVDSENQKRLLLEKMEALKKKKAERAADPSPSRNTTSELVKSKDRLRKLTLEKSLDKSRAEAPPTKTVPSSTVPKATPSKAFTPVLPSSKGSAHAPPLAKGSVLTPSLVKDSIVAASSTRDSTMTPSFASKAAEATGKTPSFAKTLPKIIVTKDKASSQFGKVPPSTEVQGKEGAKPPAIAVPKPQPQHASGTQIVRQHQMSPKKRPAFQSDDHLEQATKKARFDLSKKWPSSAQKIAGADEPHKAVFSGAGKKTGDSALVGGEAVVKSGNIATVPKDNVVSGTMEFNASANSTRDLFSSKVKQPAKTASPHAIHQHRPGGVTVPTELKKRLETDAKRLGELVAAVTSLVEDNEQGAGEARPSLQRCDPTSVQDFFDRLHTFQPSTWIGYGHEHLLSPVECARRGWFNSGPNQLASSEGAKIIANFEGCKTLETFTEEEGRVKSLVLGQGHKLLSGWIGKSCPEEFETLLGSKKVFSSDELQAHAKEFISSRAISFLDRGQIDWEEHPEFLKGEDKSVKLAVCNWSVGVLNDEEVDVRCDWCSYRLALADEELIGKEAACGVRFSLQRSHYPYCPFSRDEEAVRRNAEIFGIASLKNDGQKGGMAGGDEDVQMVDV